MRDWYTVWCPDWHQTEATGESVLANTPRNAASGWAEGVVSDGQSVPHVVVHVRDPHSGDVTRWHVYSRTVVTYHADPVGTSDDHP